jgi:ribosomal protein S18 acetylase RimI-like enzyme
VDLAPVEPLHPATDVKVAAELLALQIAAYRVEAELIGSDAIPALHETPATLVAAGLCWIGCRDGEGLLGAAAVAETPEIVDLDRLVVAPRAFRRGIGRRLVAAVVEIAEHRPVVVSTGRDNMPARALYACAGFRETGQREVVPGLWTVSYTLDSTASTSSADAAEVGDRS